MNVLVCGDRAWKSYETVLETLRSVVRHNTHTGQIIVLHGAATGADSMAGQAAKELGLKVRVFPADWTRFGKAAGPIRNAQMLREGKPDVVYAFHNAIDYSKGTKNMVLLAISAKVSCYLVSVKDFKRVETLINPPRRAL